jgi:hypothetical protein
MRGGHAKTTSTPSSSGGGARQAQSPVVHAPWSGVGDADGAGSDERCSDERCSGPHEALVSCCNAAAGVVHAPWCGGVEDGVSNARWSGPPDSLCPDCPASFVLHAPWAGATAGSAPDKEVTGTPAADAADAAATTGISVPDEEVSGTPAAWAWELPAAPAWPASGTTRFMALAWVQRVPREFPPTYPVHVCGMGAERGAGAEVNPRSLRTQERQKVRSSPIASDL